MTSRDRMAQPRPQRAQYLCTRTRNTAQWGAEVWGTHKETPFSSANADNTQGDKAEGHKDRAQGRAAMEPRLPPVPCVRRRGALHCHHPRVPTPSANKAGGCRDTVLGRSNSGGGWCLGALKEHRDRGRKGLVYYTSHPTRWPRQHARRNTSIRNKQAPHSSGRS